jgi:predicted kinase
MNFKHIKEPFVILLIGPPLSGKSTWIKNTIPNREDIDIIGVDYIIMDTYASNNDNYNDAYQKSNFKDVNRILKERLDDAADNHRNVIVDMTNMASKRRRTTLSHFDDEYFKVAVIFPILDWEEYSKRNISRRDREGKYIPESVIRSMISSYTPINSDEGFDKVISL